MTVLTYLRIGFYLKNEPIYIGGQIGIGKSTFINKYFRDNSFIPDIILHFDTNGNNLSSGDFLQILLTEIINYAILNNYDISSFITPEAFTNGKINRWEEYVKIFNTDHIDLSIFNFKESVIANLIKNRKYISEVLCKIVLYYEKILERPLIFFASGIDKFENNSAALLMLQDSIEFLANFKTIFEVNAIHFFSDFIPESSLRIFLLPFRADRIIELLDKRMGVYSNRISDVITEIGENSGGNPRQAIRLLTNYLNFKSLGVESKNAVKLSKETTQNDFFLFAKRPSDVLLKYVKKNKSLSTTTFKLPGDNETALRALYSNWIFINNNSIEESKWSVEVNPLVTQLIDTKGVKEYDQIILDNYLVNNQISPSGSNIPIKDENANNNNYYYASFRNEIEKEKDYSFYISKTLDLISYSLLSKDREERIIIAYKDKSIIKPIRYYLFAKANTFEYQSFSHYDLEKNNLPLSMQILDIMNKGNADIYSFDFNAINKETNGRNRCKTRYVSKKTNDLVDSF